MRGIRGVVVLTVLLLSFSLAADSVQHSLIFESLDQSLWGPGQAAAPGATRLHLLKANGPVTWLHETSGYPGYVGSFGKGLVGDEWGGGARAKTSGEVGLSLGVTWSDLGSVDVRYPVTPRIEFPDANTFKAGDTVKIYTSYDVAGDALMTTTSPKVGLGLDFSFAFFAEVGLKGCLGVCATASPVSINVPRFEKNIFTVRQDGTVEDPWWKPAFSFGALPVEGSIHMPQIGTTSTLSGKSLTGSGTDTFLGVSIDVVNLAIRAAGIGIPSSYQEEDVVPGVDVDYTILRVAPRLDLTARQSFRFDPDLKLTLAFAKPVEYRVGDTGAFTLGSSVQFKVGETLQVRYPSTDKQPTSVGPTYTLDNTFSSSTGFGASGSLHVKAGELKVHIDGSDIIGVQDLHLGPLYETTESLGASDLGTPFNSSWKLEGFPAQTVAAFSLDPENPIIHLEQQTGTPRNLGQGRRQVPYKFILRNGGDVPLSDLHLVADLQTAFSAAYSFKVDEVLGCDIAVSSEFDGVNDKELLAAGASLDVGQSAQVIVVVSVYPKPDPPVYTLASTDDGTSPNDTVVSDTASSGVLLGPGVIRRLSDFVLFGEHFVKLDTIANTYGHIGSNDFIEVKNGNSTFIAGDLRAGRTIKVQGEIMADYAYSGGIIDVVRRAKLNLTGSMTQGAVVPARTLSAPSPATPLKGNVWVPQNGSDLLQPGHYGDVVVNAGAALHLERGVYTFLSLTVLDNASVNVLGTSRQGLVHVLGDAHVKIGRASSFRGSLNAPTANITFDEGSSLEGTASGRTITLRPGAAATYHRDCDRLVDPNCDGTKDCGK